MKIGIILVLFILLVIVVQTFYWENDYDDNGSSSITGTQTFTIKNNTSQYRLRFSSRTGPGNLPENPNIYPNSSGEFVVRTSGVSPVNVTVRYNIYDLSNINVGYFTFIIEASDVLGFTKLDHPNIRTPEGVTVFAFAKTVSVTA
ncbi:hypothetical protein [Paenibacillus herberti]|uniref:Uncharacterized protein n=1 Tax=Paenibacillus herberti TaxID=1619309 RepID=A0A229P1J1_9BACL|nr:hypothetical protein [Paenibacillus herberti]OXM15789.1 hypothetical protein CGZ75_03460 [Paenibacillus herberti]